MSVGKTGIGEYLVQRTHYRPRDIIMFFNSCIQKAIGSPTISLSMLREAESEYSSARLQALYDEWRTDYPDLDWFWTVVRPIFDVSPFAMGRAFGS